MDTKSPTAALHPDIKFSSNDEEAENRAKQYLSVDPFPDVVPALLSAEDVEDYIRVTGMLYPFEKGGDNIKKASVEVFAGGEFIYWEQIEGKKSKVQRRIDRHKTPFIILPANSITYVQAEPRFRLPNYIALRFNLRITHVHRGLLLGTGPLVDPGFDGNLLIPLHNLTSTDYQLDLSKALIWVEFTKTSKKYPAVASVEESEELGAFPEEKKRLTPTEYLDKANGGDPILSAIYAGLDSAIAESKKATETAAMIRNVGYVALAALLLGGITLVVNVLNVAQGSLAISNSVKQNLESVAVEGTRNKESIISLQDTIAAQRAENVALKADLEGLQQQINTLRGQIAPRVGRGPAPPAR